jgi:hypothetical protein
MTAPRRIRPERRIRVGRQTQVGRARAVAQICREAVARHAAAEVADATGGISASSGKVHSVSQKIVLRQNVAA